MNSNELNGTGCRCINPHYEVMLVQYQHHMSNSKVMVSYCLSLDSVALSRNKLEDKCGVCRVTGWGL